jgi:hypothetical protein
MVLNRAVTLIFRASCFLFVSAGLYAQMFALGEFRTTMFMYYTIQSNILALAMFAILLVRTAKGWIQDGFWGSAGYFAQFEMVCVIDLLVTLIVYWVMLAPNMFMMAEDFQLWTFENLAVHLITPLLCLIDYILFTPSNHLKYRNIYGVLIYPLFYVGFSWIAGFSGYVYRISAEDGLPVRFPYFFIDFDRLGYEVFLYMIILIIFFLLLSHSLYWIDKKLKKPILLQHQ